MNADRSTPPVTGIAAALLTPVFLGMAPIFGKLANNAGATPFAIASVRTIIAVAILWIVYLIFFRRFIFIYPAGLIGCIIVGSINGIGSLFYYSGLGLLDASLTQLVNGMYLVFAVLLTRIGGERITARVWLRLVLALIGLFILTGFGEGQVNPIGVGYMLGSALMFAGTIIFSQYVLFEMPAPTATLYILTTMAVIVTMAWLPTGEFIPVDQLPATIVPIFLLGLTTALSRLLLFASVKFMGSLQSAITALAEIGAALLLAFLVLGETLTATQWVGVAIMGGTLLLIRQEDLKARGFDPNAILVANMPRIQYQRIAFHRAFGTTEMDNEQETMQQVTTMEMIAIRDMMGVENKPVDPFPIYEVNRGLQEHNGGYSVDLQEFLDNYDGEET
ncbi:MAG: DMT family transporter [Chloroflexota bacterium]